MPKVTTLSQKLKKAMEEFTSPLSSVASTSHASPPQRGRPTARTPPNGHSQSEDIFRTPHANCVLQSPAGPAAEGWGDHFSGPMVYAPLNALPISAQAPPSDENPFGPPPGYGKQPTTAALPVNLARNLANIFTM